VPYVLLPAVRLVRKRQDFDAPRLKGRRGPAEPCRMIRLLVATVMAMGIVAAGCGGGGGAAAGEPLVAGSLTGEYKGQTFTPAFGFATLYQGSNLIGVGDGPLNCASAQQPDPPTGTNALIDLPAFDVGSYSSVFVEIIQNKGSFAGMGENSGTVTIDSADATSIAGSVAFSYTSSSDGQHYAISGTFQVTRCPM